MLSISRELQLSDLPNDLLGPLIEQAADLVTAGGSSALGSLITNRPKGGLGFSVVSHS